MPLSLLKKRPVKQPTGKPKTTWLDVDGLDIPVIIHENPRSKRLNLRIMPGGKELRISAPPRTPFRDIDAFLYKHRNWAAARLSRMPKIQTIADGCEFMLRGIAHQIVHKGKGRGLVKTVKCGDKMQLHVYGDHHHLSRRVVDYLKRQAKSDLAQAVKHHSANLAVNAKSITLRDTKTRWGSCSSSGALSFSWRIILAPPEVLDYLAAHEVAHLREMNHSPQFWKLVEETCPHTKSSRAWLRTHGSNLHALVA